MSVLQSGRKRSRLPRIYPVAELLDVHDGDTARFRIDTGFDFTARKWIRFRNVSAKELKEPGGPEAKIELVNLLNERAPDGIVTVTTFWTPGTYKEINEEMTFVRYVGDVKLYDGFDVNEHMRTWLEIHGLTGGM
jgi:endonuclease YncB( thermonuclease family)